MKTFLFSAALVASTALSGAAHAQTETPPDAQHPTARVDAGERQTKAEFIARAGERFARLDKNGDGKITADEITPPSDGAAAQGGRARFGGMMRQRMFERMDTNHDGIVTRAEFDAASAERFDRMDTNHDGFLDQSEMTAMRERARGMMQRGADSAPPPQNPGQ